MAQGNPWFPRVPPPSAHSAESVLLASRPAKPAFGSDRLPGSGRPGTHARVQRLRH
jgi:hypothetical protein